MSKLTGLALARNQDGNVAVVVTSADEEGFPGAVWRTSESPTEQRWISLGGPGSGVSSGPAVARNSDGRLEAFVRGKDLAVWHAWQREPGHNWSGWHSLEAPSGQRVTSIPVLAQNQDGRLELFTVADDRAVWHRWQQGAGRGPWTAWHSLENQAGGFDELAVGRYVDGRLILFATQREEGALWQREQTVPNNGWSPWTLADRPATLGNPGMGSIEWPTVASKTDGLVELWLRLPTLGQDVLYRRFQNPMVSTVWGANWFDFFPKLEPP
jgi:hypothetical protein